MTRLLLLANDVKKIGKLWDRFWFRSGGYPQMRLFRRGLAFLLLFSYLIRTLDLDLYFSENGLAPTSILPDIIDLKYRLSFLTIFPGANVLRLINGFFLMSLLCLGLGIFTRYSAVIALMLHLSFLHRNPGSVYGADTVTTFFLAFLCLSDFRYSSNSDLKSQDSLSVLGSIAYRLSQFQLCIIYAYAGLHKLKGVHWWNGVAVWEVLANAQMARWDFSWIAHYPLLFILPTYATLLFEIYFPVLVWIPAARKPLLYYGLLLHLGIGLAMNIPIFAALMVLSYVLFLDSETAERWNLSLEKIFTMPSRAVLRFGNSPRVNT